MADTVGPDARYIPTKFSKVAGYRTGGPDVMWTPGDAQRFTTSSIVWVDQSSTLASYSQGLAYVADIERGAGTIDAYIAAARTRQSHNLRNCLYASWDNIPALVADIEKASLDIGTTDFWVANWNFDQAQASEFVGVYKLNMGDGKIVDINVPAVQWASPSSNPETIVPFSDPPMNLKDANVDLSETAPNWYPFVVPQPPVVVVTMTGLVVTSGFQTFKVISTDNGKTWRET